MADETESAKAADSASLETRPRRQVSTRQSIERFLMIFLGLLAVFAMFDAELSHTFGALVGVVLYPVIGFGGRFPVLTILLAGMLTTTLSSVLRDHYTDWIKTMRNQKVMAAWRKENMDAVRKGDQTRIKKMREYQQQMMKDSMDVQMAPMKSMAWTFFFFIVLFVWLRTFVDGTLGGLGNQFLAVPWAPQVYVDSVYVLPAWILLYSLLALPIGQIITRVLKYVRFRRKLLALGLSQKPGPEESV